MRKKFLVKIFRKVSLTFFISLLITSARDEISETTNYTLSVTIPPHVEISQEPNSSVLLKKDQELTREQVSRDNQIVILETITVK